MAKVKKIRLVRPQMVLLGSLRGNELWINLSKIGDDDKQEEEFLLATSMLKSIFSDPTPTSKAKKQIKEK